MLHYFGMSFPCTHGMAKYLEPSHAGPVLENYCIGDSKPKFKQIDLATVETVDTLPDLDDADSTDFERSVSADSVSSGSSLQREINLSILDAAQIQDWCPSDYDMVKTLQPAPRNKGRVDLMRSAQTGKFAAVKRMPNTWMKNGPAEFDNAHPESSERPWFDIGIIKYLHESGFDHVCQPWGVFADGLNTYVVSSYASEGELFSWLELDPAPGPEREAMVRPIMRQLFSAVRWLHQLGVAHCDISLENVLLTDEGAGPIVKLIDFGMATLNRRGTAASGKKSYMAPEMFLEGDFDVFATDAFALGVCAFGVCCREYPWNSTQVGTCKLFNYVQKNGLQTFLERRKVYGAENPQQRLAEALSKPLQTLLVGLLEMTPQKRLTLGETQAYEQQLPSVWSATDWLTGVK